MLSNIFRPNIIQAIADCFQQKHILHKSMFISMVRYSYGYQYSNSLLWRHNRRDGVSNHQLNDCLLNRSFGRRSKKTSKIRVTGLCAGKSPVTGEFPAQMASNAENVSIWWRHHVSKFFIVRPLSGGSTSGLRHTEDQWRITGPMWGESFGELMNSPHKRTSYAKLVMTS